MTLERFKVISDIVAAWFGLLALTAAGIFTIVQYVEKEKADRIKASLDLLPRFHDANMTEARTGLYSAWRRRETELATVAADPAISGTMLDKYVLNVVDEENLYLPFQTVTDFYDTVQICIEQKICDGSTAKALFQHDARSFLVLHYPLIASIRSRRKDTSFAAHLEQFVQ